MVIYNPRFRFRPSLNAGQRILLEVEIAFSDWLKNSQASPTFNKDANEKNSKGKITSIPSNLENEIIQLGNKLSPSELKAVKSRFHKVVDDFILKGKYKEIIPKEKKCCECSDAKFVIKGREDLVLEYLCQSMKRIIIHIFQRINLQLSESWPLKHPITSTEESTSASQTSSSEMKAFSNQCWSSSPSSGSLSSFGGSSITDPLYHSQAHLHIDSPSQCSSLSSLNPETSSSLSIVSKSELSSPKHSNRHSIEASYSSFDDEDSSLATSGYFSLCQVQEDSETSVLKNTPCSSSQRNISTPLKDGRHLISSYDALTLKLKRNVSTQTDEAPSSKLYFRKSSTGKVRSCKRKVSVSATLLGEIDSLPRRLGDVLRSNKFFQSKNDSSKIQIRSNVNPDSGDTKPAKELHQLKPFEAEELLKALKNIENHRSAEGATTDPQKNLLEKNEKSGETNSGGDHLATCASLSSSSGSSLSSSGCSSPKNLRRRLCGSGYSVFTISGHLRESSEYTGKYSFKSYSVAHC